jgi:hypothetical protein
MEFLMWRIVEEQHNVNASNFFSENGIVMTEKFTCIIFVYFAIIGIFIY